jgi:hypothetical protein
MTEQHVWAWRRKAHSEIVLPQSPRKTIEELFKYSSFGLPVREVASHVPVRVVLKDGKWVEDTMDEKERLWATVVAASSR